MKMPSKLFGDDDGEVVTKFEIDEDYALRLEHNRKREELQRFEELKRRGKIVDEDDDSESGEESEEDEVIGGSKKELEFFCSLVKVKKQDPSIKNKDVKLFESDEEKDDNKKESKKEKKKKVYLKDVQGYAEEEEEDSEKKVKVKSFVEEQEELRKAVSDAVMENEEDGEELFKERDGDGDGMEEEDEELVKKMDEYFGDDDGEVEENNKFLKDYFLKQMWKEKDGDKKKRIDDAELDAEEDDEDAVEMQEEYELSYRHEENAGEVVMGHSRKVEGSVRKKDSARNRQRENKEERMRMAAIEREEELKQLKNVKKKEIKKKMKKVFKVAGFKKGDEIALDAEDLEGEFDAEEHDKLMKGLFGDDYYKEEDLGLSGDEDCEKPDFDKEDELLGLPKNWEGTQRGDGFTTAREMALKHKVTDDGDDEEKEEEEEEKDEEEKEEEMVEGKRKRKRKTSLVQRAKEALMEEYYKLDYEDTIGDLKTRFHYAKVVPNRFDLETEEILGLDDKELNKYVPLKKIAPYREKDYEVNKHKVKEQKLKNKELLSGKHDEKRSKKKSTKQSDTVTDLITTTKPASGAEEVEGEETKLSRKAKRRRRQAEKKLPPNRMAAYGKTQ